jgi:hypothetical protein
MRSTVRLSMHTLGVDHVDGTIIMMRSAVEGFGLDVDPNAATNAPPTGMFMLYSGRRRDLGDRINVVSIDADGHMRNTPGEVSCATAYAILTQWLERP